MTLTPAARDRVAGTLLATAAGDALGAPYEFGPPLSAETVVGMTGGGSLGWGVGEWTDDTSMAVAVAELTAAGRDLRDEAVQDALVARWADWARTAKDVGNQTRHVLAVAAPTAASVGRAAADLHARTGHTGGNGSLMRTAPVALAYLDDPRALTDAATAVSSLTHADPETGEACVLWCRAIAHAVHTGDLDVRSGLDAFEPTRREIWAERIAVAERSTPADFTRNGWVVEAFQAAWCAIATTRTPDGPTHLRQGLEAAVRGGRDTDTVAAIAGGLLGAAYGASAVPAEWRRVLHGWPGLRADDLEALALASAGAAEPDVRAAVQRDLTAALKRRDRIATGALRSLLSALANAEAVERPTTDGTGSATVAGAAVGLGAAEADRRMLDADAVDAVVAAEIAERDEASAAYRSTGAVDRADEVATEAEILRRYRR